MLWIPNVYFFIPSKRDHFLHDQNPEEHSFHQWSQEAGRCLPGSPAQWHLPHLRPKKKKIGLRDVQAHLGGEVISASSRHSTGSALSPKRAARILWRSRCDPDKNKSRSGHTQSPALTLSCFRARGVDNPGLSRPSDSWRGGVSQWPRHALLNTQILRFILTLLDRNLFVLPHPIYC